MERHGRLLQGSTLAFLALVALGLVLVTRVPFAPTTLSLDNVNLAFAIEQFDPWMHQPHPPGYPFFVGEARLLNLLFQDPEKTFLFISVMLTTLSIGMLFVIGRSLFSTSAALVGALLLTFNPTFWHATLNGPLRPQLAFFSLAVGYLCWRMWTTGECRYGLWAAAALGIGSGFRPDLLLYVFPLWCMAQWKGRTPWSDWIRGIGIIFGFVVTWAGLAAFAVGGLDRYTLLVWVYSFSQFGAGSVLMAPPGRDWIYQLTHLVAWNFVGMISWAWLLPVWLFVRHRTEKVSDAAAFIAAWIGPGIVAQALLHVAAPGHTLFATPAICLVGGQVVTRAIKELSVRHAPVLQASVAAVAVLLNLFVFFNGFSFKFPLPPSAGEYVRMVRDAFADGVYETTFENLRSNNELSESAIGKIRNLSASDRPVVLISTEGSSKHFRFLSWRIASYYVDDRDFWVVADEQSPPRATRVRGKDVLEIRYGATVKIPVPSGSRIIWLMDSGSPFRQAVKQVTSLRQDGPVYHTDLAEDTAPFRVQNFEFVIEQGH